MSTAASVGSVVVAFIALLVSILNTTKKDAKNGGSQMAMVITKLDGLSDDMRELKNDMVELRQSLQDDHDRIVKMEMRLENFEARLNEKR